MKASNYRSFCVAALSLLAACTRSDQRSPNAPVDHWVMIGRVATVAARDGDAYLSASCYYGQSLALLSAAKVSDQPEARSLALGFDGSAPSPQAWKSRDYPAPRWGFETGATTNTNFAETISGLSKHREAEVVVREAGREILHVHFSLTGAGEALAAALQGCVP